MALDNWERTTDTPTTQFFEFMKFLAENDLLDSASAYCESKDLNQVRISVEHIRAIQEMIQKSQGESTAGATAVILSAHVDGACGST